ncbi:MAG TPA: flagellar hook protein FlgE [Actinomycetales bacterium]|nr:flagellar hook protein FlgE [Actinomycetales bacterium]
MLRSLFSGISGLRANQTMMDVTGNNIANVNTVGFKSSSVVFQDTLSQLLQGAKTPAAGSGGSNPAQVGLGVKVAGITQNFGQGAAQTTGRATDMMIQGDGFFIEKANGQTLYTRGGALSFDGLGQLVTPTGAIMQGWVADANGAINTNGPTADIRLPLGATLAPKITENVALKGNLPADVADGTQLQTSVDVYDDLGTPHTLAITLTKNPGTPPTWGITAQDMSTATPTPLTLSSATVSFDSTGKLTTPSPLTTTLGGQPLNLDLGSMTGYAGQSSLGVDSQDGFAAGSLQGFSIGPDGVLTGVFSGGRTQALGQLALATFANPGGLTKAGDSTYQASANSGLAQVGTPGSGSRGELAGGVLEMSNVDLAQEFTNLIIAQRGFQANSRVITASDEILQDLVNIKR